ncbi:DUF6339 family protein [Spongorhabdus nitratireducens]
MDSLKILNSSSLSKLRSALLNSEDIPELYLNSDIRPIFTEDCFVNTTIKVPSTVPNLKVDITSDRTRAKDDAKNALLIYEYLGSLSRTQASDTRLWVTLTHSIFWDYTFARWPSISKNSYILEHWFEKKGGGLGALRRNSISRLWWAAYLTVAPWERNSELDVFKSSDREKYTHILLSQQQIFFDVLERSYGSSDKVRICLLDALSHFLPKVKSKDNLSKSVVKKLSLLIKHKQLESISINSLRKELYDLVESCV